MSEQKSPRSLGRGAEEWSRYDTYATHQARWDRAWDCLSHCQITKEIGPLGCWEIDPVHCRDHPSIKSSLDYQQDGRWRLRLVVATGDPPPSPRQKNIRLPLLVYSFFRENPEFRPLANNRDSVGHPYEYSHLCHNPFCINPEHCVYETKAANQGRDWCDRDTCQGRHNPACVTSAADKRWAHDHSREVRTKLRSDPWRRGDRLKAEAAESKSKKRKMPPCEQQSITQFMTTSPNH